MLSNKHDECAELFLNHELFDVNTIVKNVNTGMVTSWKLRTTIRKYLILIKKKKITNLLSLTIRSGNTKIIEKITKNPDFILEKQITVRSSHLYQKNKS